MVEKFDYDYITKEIEKRLNNGLIADTDIVTVTGWLEGINSDIPQMREVNAKFLSNYLKKGLSKNQIDATNYKEVCSDIFSFLDNHKDLDGHIVYQLKSYISILGNESVSNEEKYKISENFYDIRRNIKFKEKSIKLLEIIKKKYIDNIEYTNKLYGLIEILLDEAKPLIEREKAELDIDDVLKYEKELSSLQHSSK